LAPAQ